MKTKSFDEYVKQRLTPEEIAKIKQEVSEQRDFIAEVWEILGQLRKGFLKQIEKNKEINHPREARFTLYLSLTHEKNLMLLIFLKTIQHQTPEEFLKEWLGCSQVEIIFTD